MRSARFIFLFSAFAYACSPAAPSLTDDGNPLDRLDPKSEAAATCTVKQNDDGSATITCPDGTTATVVGQQGEQGAKGEKGDKGDKGDTGTAGSSCSVLNNNNGTFTMTCINGTNVTWSSSGTGGANPYIPDGVLHGTYTVENSLDLAFLNGVTQVTGALSVKAPGLTSLALPTLTKVGNDLDIKYNTNVTSLSMPSLSGIGGNLNINNNPALTSLSLPLVTNLSGFFYLQNNLALPLVNLPALQKVAGLYAVEATNASTAALTTLSAPALTDVAGPVAIYGLPNLSVLSLPALTKIGNWLSITYTGLSTFALSVTDVGGRVEIRNNASLESFFLDSLIAINGELYISYNPNLCNTFATDLVMQVTNETASYIVGNNGSCPP